MKKTISFSVLLALSLPLSAVAGDWGVMTWGQDQWLTAGTATTTCTASSPASCTTETDCIGANGTWLSGACTATATNQLPTASFTLTPATGGLPVTVSLDASGSDDPDGTISSYSWTTSDNQTATGVTTDISFSQEGTYIIDLTVTDDQGASSLVSQTITITSGSATITGYTATARLAPQVIAGGVAPSQVDLNDTSFDVVALVRPGALPTSTVTFRSNTTGFAMAMSPAGVLTNGDEIYKTTLTFARGSMGTMTYSTAWGPAVGQFNVHAIDTAQQQSHQFPDLMVGNYPAVAGSRQTAADITYDGTIRLAPQVIMGGFSPTLLDLTDTSFDVIAVVRAGALPIDRVSVNQNNGGFAMAMTSAGIIDTIDELYKVTLTFARGSFGTTTINTLWGNAPGEFHIEAVDTGQQTTHAFPDIEFGNYPEL